MGKDLELGKRIAWLRTDRGFEQTQAASEINIKFGTYQRYEYGYVPSRKNVDKLLIYYKCNRAWLVTGEGEPFPGTGHGYPDVYGPERPVFNDEFALIPQVVGSISAGGGRIPDNSSDYQCAFRRDWIRRKGGNPDNMSLIKVAGDSMEPALRDGDLVLVDHGRNNIASQGGIYAIALGDEIMVKRVQPIFPNKLLVISDNKQYPAQEIATENVRVNGKVIWYARDLER